MLLRQELAGRTLDWAVKIIIMRLAGQQGSGMKRQINLV